MKPITTAIVTVIVLVALALIGLTIAQTAHGAFIVKPAGGYNTGTTTTPESYVPEIQSEPATATITRRARATSNTDEVEEARIEELQKIVVKLTALLNELLAQKTR